MPFLHRIAKSMRFRDRQNAFQFSNGKNLVTYPVELIFHPVPVIRDPSADIKDIVHFRRSGEMCPGVSVRRRVAHGMLFYI